MKRKTFPTRQSTGKVFEYIVSMVCEPVDRAKGWGLWKALITYTDSNALVSENARRTLNEIINEYDESTPKKSIITKKNGLL